MICIEQEPSVFDCAPSQLSEPTLQKQIQKQFGMAQILEKMGPVCSSLGFGVKSKAQMHGHPALSKSEKGSTDSEEQRDKELASADEKADMEIRNQLVNICLIAFVQTTRLCLMKAAEPTSHAELLDFQVTHNLITASIYLLDEVWN